MVGEDTSLRNRLSKSSENLKEDEDQKQNALKESLETQNNGELDIKQLISKKIQLTAEAEQLKPFFMKEVGSQFDEFVTNLIEKSASLDIGRCALTSFSVLEDKKNKCSLKHLRASPEKGKCFIVRRSLLDDLLEVDHIRTVYHMFTALLILFSLSTLLINYIDEGRLVLEFGLLSYAFGKLPVVVCTWWAMFLSTLSVPYFLFQHWARGYRKSSHPTMYSVFHASLFLFFQIGILCFGPLYIIFAYTLPPASRFIVIFEQLRFIMKAHSFIRENVPRVLDSIKEKSSLLEEIKELQTDKQSFPFSGTVPIPTVNQYLYFLFAPTLIYRDSYPRTPTVRWSYVATQFAQCFACIFYVYYILERLCIPLFGNIKQEPFSARVLVLCFFNSILPGTLIAFNIFFGFFHSWFNAFAEMLRFGDRMFYKDWWNSTSFSSYFRTWNVVVHDWLYYYVYKDLLWFLSKKFKFAAMLATFVGSGIVHEYILTVGFNFFYPVLFVFFIFFGMTLNFIVNDSRKRPIWNLMLWISLFLGHGMVVCLYSQEWYAHQHCPLKNPTFLDYIRPRSWTCYYVF